MGQREVGVAYLSLIPTTPWPKNTLVPNFQSGGNREWNLAVGQPPSLFTYLFPQSFILVGKIQTQKNPDYLLSGRADSPWEKYTVHLQDFIAQITLPKGSGSKAKVQRLRKFTYGHVCHLAEAVRGWRSLYPRAATAEMGAGKPNMT